MTEKDLKGDTVLPDVSHLLPRCDITLTIQLQRLAAPKIDPKMMPTKSLKIYMIPANGDPPHVEEVQTIRMPLPHPSRTSSYNFLAFQLKKDGEGYYLPSIRDIPDTRWAWGDHGFEKRAAFQWEEYHVFFTRAKGESLLPNKHTDTQHVRYNISGDVFFLKVSNKTDEAWKVLEGYYVDVDDKAEKRLREKMEYVLEVVAHNFFWNWK